MATAKRRPWNQMDHDSELLREEIVYATRTELRGPIPEFLAKKRAEQAPGTAAGYEVVFGVFERLHTAREFPGTGIGLAIVMKGVKRMGGRVGVTSDPAHGSTFWFELPKA